MADREYVTGSNGATAKPLIYENGRNLNIRLAEHKRATKMVISTTTYEPQNQLETKFVKYRTNYSQWLTLESWFTNLEQTPLNRCQQLPAST